MRGYRDEDGVEPGSETPTFVGIRLFVDSWRWQGVPFYLRTGKRLPSRATHIAITYRTPHLCIFHGDHDLCEIGSDVLLITLQPDEGFSVTFNVRSPDRDNVLDPQNLHFRYAHSYGTLPDAYQTLILDTIQGDQTLFVRADEVEASWKVYTPLLSGPWELHRYEAGTWGPAAMDRRLALVGDQWTGR